MLTFTDEEFEKLKQGAEALYKSIKEGVLCPYFSEKISFNAKGIEHLKFSRKNHARPRQDQYMRLKLLHLAPRVLGLSKTIQGISERTGFELVRSSAHNEILPKFCTYYEFVAIIDKSRVRIVVKQVESGPKYFWSIIPFWKYDEKNKKRRMCYGNPEED
jgi:hypothetical protein